MWRRGYDLGRATSNKSQGDQTGSVISPIDARRLLGLPDDASAAEVSAARRRMAKQRHPDVVGGDAEEMRLLNEAADIVLDELNVVAPHHVGAQSGPDAPPGRPAGTGRFAHETASFVVEALPVVAYEALLVVTSWIGEVVVDEPPYELDVLILDPLRCWCRLDLVPDAGSSTVSVTLAALPDEPLPDLDDVRDLWVASLNRLGR